MKRIGVFVMLLLFLGCRKEEKLEKMGEFESADLNASAFNFQIFPNAEFLPKVTDLLRRAHFVMNPAAKTAPPMACYVTDASVEDVARFYVEKYGYPKIEEAQSKSAHAWYLSGDLQSDALAVKPVLEKLNVPLDPSKAVGGYRGAHVKQSTNFPRVTIQRPYFDMLEGKVVDRTLLLLVRD